MSLPLHVLLIEDSEDDALLLIRELRRGGYELSFERIETPTAMTVALAKGRWDLILADYALPRFSAPAALMLLQQHSLDIPFIIVSGAISEETAVTAMKAGAHDYLTKGNLVRLLPAVERELRDAKARAARHAAETELARSEARKRAILETALDAIITIDHHGRILEFNRAAEAMFGIARSDILDRVVTEVVLPFTTTMPDNNPFLSALSATPSTAEGKLVETTARRADGSEFPVEFAMHRIAVEDPPLFTAYIRDISERKAAEQQRMRHAFYDGLVGLPNRALFLDRLGYLIARAQHQDDLQFAVFVIDLDLFKHINERIGFATADHVLITIARRLETSLDPSTTLARLGGDEFAVLVEHVDSLETAQELAQRTQHALSVPVLIDEHHIQVSASIGIVLSTADDKDAESVVRNAEIAMYRAKASGRGQHALFENAMYQRALARSRLETDLRRALDQQEFLLHYQPIVAVTDGSLLGVEALLRWHHPEHGLVAPAEFIPVAEETGLIDPIGAWVLQAACAQARAWQSANIAPFYVSVNLSASQFKQPDLGTRIAAVLTHTGLAPQWLKLELTESDAMHDAKATSATLHQLVELGLQFAIDDFGTGYSSLAYLQRFPIATLKIDRAFVRECTASPNDAVIAATIIGMAHTLNLGVIAEGVETAEQFAFLQQQHCDAVQGYLFSRPLAAPTLTTMLTRGHRFAPQPPTS